MKSILKYVRVFDCIFYANISKMRKSKLDEKLKKTKFIRITIKLRVINSITWELRISLLVDI